MNIGQSYRPLGNLISLRNYVVETGIIKKVCVEIKSIEKCIQCRINCELNSINVMQCKKRGMEDYVELLGGNNLDPYHMTVFEDMCGLRSFSCKCTNGLLMWIFFYSIYANYILHGMISGYIHDYTSIDISGSLFVSLLLSLCQN